MRVTLTNGKLIDVKFRKEEIRPGVVRSFCRISKVKDASAKGRDNYKLIVEAFATRNPSDAPNKAVGFKQALANAINGIGGSNPMKNVVDIGGAFTPRLQDKKDRQQIWNAFLSVYKKNLD